MSYICSSANPSARSSFGLGPSGTEGYFADNGVPLPEVAAWIATIVELVGGIRSAGGLRNVKRRKEVDAGNLPVRMALRGRSYGPMSPRANSVT